MTVPYLEFVSIPTAVTDDGITVNPSSNAGEWTVTGATSVSQLQSAIQQLKVVGPEDYAGAMKVTVSARAAESGVPSSPYISNNFTVNLSAVAEAPTLTVSNITDAVEDAAKALNESITMAAVDKDGSDEIISVQIEGLSFQSNGATLQAAIVDSSGNSVGIPDGSGGVTLTKAQYDAGIKLQPPANYFGDIAIGVTATTRDGTSTASSTQSLTVSFAAVSEEPVVSISGDLSGTEDTTVADTASSDGVALTNVTLSIADSEAVATADGKILIANTNDSALSGVRINTTGVTDGGITVSASGNAGEWTVTGATSVSQLQSAIQQLKVIGPEDYAGAMKVTVSARAAESGVDASPYASGNFTVNLSAVAEAPTLTVSNITDAVEDAAKALNESITMAAVDKDGSDEIISVQIDRVIFSE